MPSFTLALIGLVGVTLLTAMFWLLNRTPRDEAVERLALLQGVKRQLGETEESLKRRSVSLSRWPHKVLAPEVAWWASLWARIAGSN
jgi:di/tricarboxylate transporter